MGREYDKVNPSQAIYFVASWVYYAIFLTTINHQNIWTISLKFSENGFSLVFKLFDQARTFDCAPAQKLMT